MSPGTHPCATCGRAIDSRFTFRTCVRCSLAPIVREVAKRKRHLATVRRRSGKRLARLRAKQLTTQQQVPVCHYCRCPVTDDATVLNGTVPIHLACGARANWATTVRS